MGFRTNMLVNPLTPAPSLRLHPSLNSAQRLQKDNRCECVCVLMAGKRPDRYHGCGTVVVAVPCSLSLWISSFDESAETVEMKLERMLLELKLFIRATLIVFILHSNYSLWSCDHVCCSVSALTEATVGPSAMWPDTNILYYGTMNSSRCALNFKRHSWATGKHWLAQHSNPLLTDLFPRWFDVRARYCKHIPSPSFLSIKRQYK